MKQSILVIEDDMPLCWLIQKILSEDFEVTIKNDGVSAMSWLTKGNIPDLILIDYVLPNINGLDFIQGLTMSGAFRDIPFVMYSNMSKNALQEKCLKAGAMAFLEKPFDPQELIAVIKKVLHQHNSKIK